MFVKRAEGYFEERQPIGSANRTVFRAVRTKKRIALASIALGATDAHGPGALKHAPEFVAVFMGLQTEGLAGIDGNDLNCRLFVEREALELPPWALFFFVVREAFHWDISDASVAHRVSYTDMDGLHHFHLRERASAGAERGLEPFPARSIGLRALDNLMYGVGVLAPFALLPQIFQIYSTKSSSGVSLVTWALLTLSSTLWTIYAAVHKDKHLFLASGLMIMFHLTIVVGLLLY